MLKTREDAARVLLDAGWTDDDISGALRDPHEAARKLARRLMLPVRAENALVTLGISTEAELRAKLDTLTTVHGVGRKTVIEVRRALSPEGALEREQMNAAIAGVWHKHFGGAPH